MNVVVNGLMTDYQKVGRGKVILCLPGWGSTTASFSRLTDELKDKYEVLILDLPGFGGTASPPEAWRLEDYAKFVASWLKKIDEKNVYAVVGHSYGGSVAVTGLSHGDFEADRLILLASAGIRHKKPIRKNLLKAAAKIGKIVLYLLPKSQRQKVRSKFYKSIGSELTLLPHMEATFKRIIDEDIRDAAASIKLPTLLIYGTKDNQTPVADGKVLNQVIRTSRLETIEAGHFLHQEQPGEVANLIKEFLDNE